MPIYKVNGEIYDIPASKQEAFEKRYPDASVSYINAGDTYEIPLNRRDAFLKKYPGAYLTSLEVPSTEQSKTAYSPTHNYGDGSDTNARVRMFNDKPNPPLNTVRGFGKAAAQSARGLGAGVQNLWGEFTNIFTGSSRDDANALAEFDRMMSEGIDVNDATEGAWTDMGRELRTGALELLPGWMIKGWKQNVHDKAEKMKVLDTIRDVLSETGGDVGKARALLQQRAKDQSYGDRQMQAAAETMGEMKPTEGFGAWLGENMVQMIPSASALLVGAVTRSPAAAKVIGGLGIGAMTAATSGQSMYEARQAGASDYETRKTGVVDGMIEVITEKIPFDRYTKRIVGKAKKEVAEQMARALSDKNSPAREELQDLLTRANRLLGGQLFSKKTAQEYIADIMAEGASEFSAEALQTMSSIIYEEPENYPEFSEIMSNGFQGLLAGAFMGSVLGGSSLALGSQQNKQRRKEQGFVKIGLIDNGDNGMDIGEIAAYDPERQMFTITDGINSYEVGRNKIKQTFDYTYEEFESARYRQLEDEAIDNGTVTDGQMSASGQRLNKERGRFDMLMSNAGLSDEEKAEVFSSIERGDIPALPKQSDLSLWKAARSYADAYERNADMQRAREAKALSERNALHEAMEQKFGKFWQDGSETALDNGFSIVEPKTVEFGTLADGRNVYIISGVNEDGEVAAVTEDGERLFVNHTMMPNGTRIMSLDEYLNERLTQQKTMAEQERMATENTERVNDVRQQVSLGMEVNLGTQEAPIMGTVLEVMPANDGVLVQTEQGVAQLSWEKVADVLNVGTASMTDLEIAAKDAADILESESAWEEVTARTEQEVALASSAEEVAAVASEDAEPLPLKQDGSVDQTTLWNKSPERWARWNDEQRQDGSVNSINYINNALAKAQKDLDSAVKAYDKETDFEAREAMEEGISAKQERVARLSALQQSYLPENAQEQAAAQVAQETAGVQSPATQAEPSQTAQALPAPEQTIYDLFSDESLSEDEIEAYIDANVAGSQSDLDKHLNKAPKMGRDMEKYKADKAKHEEKTRELTAIRDHWRQVRVYLNPSTVEMDAEPQNALEAASKELTRKDGISLLPESFRHHTGYGRGEQVAFLSILRKKENGGMTLEAAGERLMADYPEFFDQNDPNAGLNAILEVLQSAASSSDLYKYINNAREDVARQEADAVRSAVIQQVEDAKKQTNVPYHLSEEVDENGRQFVLTSNGSLSFGEIGTDTGLTPAPILLSEGLITNPATNDGYGLVHIEARHGEQIRNAGYSSVVDFIEEVARNYDVIREGRNRDGNQTYMLQLTDKHNNTLMVELSGDGTYWNINTAGIFKTSYGANRKEVYNRHTTDRQSAETAEVSQDAEQGGTQSSSSMNTPTSSSIDKDSNNPAISNESEENVDGFTSTLDEDMPDFESMSDEEVKRMAIEAVVPETERQRFQDEKRNTLKDRIREWEQRLGAKVKVMDSIDDVTNSQAKAQIEKGGEVWGWFETSTGEVCIYLPDFMSLSTSAALSEIDKTYIHEIVSHKGLRGLLGEDSYGELCDMVWEAMTEEEQQSWMQYPGVNGNTRAAADEYIAHFAESVEYNQTIWDKIVKFIKDLFASKDVAISISDEGLTELLRASYDKLVSEASARMEPEKISLNDYLGRLGLSSPISDYMDDKLRNPHGLSESQRNQLEKEAKAAADDYHARRNAAIDEYNRMVADGKITPPTQIDRLIATANGHPDNEATQAARRSLEKRGYDWQTGQKKPAEVQSEPKKASKTIKAERAKDEKIEDFGEKIGGARKDVARAKIRDSVKLTTKDLVELKDPDKILSRKNIIKYYSEGVMTFEDAVKLLAMNMAVRGRDTIDRGVAMKKYRNLAMAWEGGSELIVEITDEDVQDRMNEYSERMRQTPDFEKKTRENLELFVLKVYNDYKATYEALNYPEVYRNLKSAYIRYAEYDGRYWVVGGPNAYRGYPFPTLEQAIAKMVKLYPEQTVAKKPSESKKDGEKSSSIHVIKDRAGYYRIKSRNIPGEIYLSGKLYSKQDAEAYLAENLDKLVERENRLLEALLGSNIGMVEREGLDYRKGKDVTPKDFLDTFGFRGVEFGNWVPQVERQAYLNKTYDAIMDFCRIVGISPKAFSLGGRLGLAFGSRGKSRALAHYEPMKEVINLTRMKGAGSLAHEWFHALDNYLAKQRSGNTSDMTTDNKPAVRQEVTDAFNAFVSAMNRLAYTRRSNRAGQYWGEVWERAARLFESYIYNELGGQNIVSPLLVKKDTLYVDHGEFSDDAWPYPSAEENEQMKPYFDRLFSTLQEQVEEDGSVTLFRAKDAGRKQAQFDIINETTPMTDDYHVGIRKVEDIKTFDEVMETARRESEEGGWPELASYPDIENSLLEEALETRRIVIYSSHPISNGTFVTPSYIQADEYSGMTGEVYSKEVSVDDIAWINTDEGQYASLNDASDRYNDTPDKDIRFRTEQTKDRVENLFTAAVNGTFKGKPVSIGTLTKEGKQYLESISGLTFKDKVDFMLNASDLVHMYNEHFGENEKDPGSNIPLTIDDIRNIVDVVLNPEKVLYLGEDEGKRFAFLAPADSGAYNLIEVYTTKRGNLSSKTFYKTKKGVSHRAMILEKESRHSTSETNGATLSDAKIPILFDIANQEEDNTRFRTSNNNQAIFVSNAAKAVEGIKQEKATPEQWLKMIEKNGGLKAGEDKWMGLSDWLKASKAKTLTKAEVLDFINENMIVVEEEKYGEVELSALQDEFNEIYYKINVGNEDESDLQLWEVVMNPMERAWEELRDRYSGGDDFDMAFSYDSHGNIEINDPDAAGHFLGVKPIDDIRLGYTTSGLQNKQEIALVVPTIESWNETDEVHFGDAGDGRAVAWIRFGETWEQRPSPQISRKVLVIDEIQSKRHQEGREKGYKSDFKNSKEAQRLKAEVDRITARLMELVNDKRENEESELTELARLDIALENATSNAEYDAILEEQEKIRTHRENREAEELAVRGKRRELAYLLDKQIDRDAVSAISAVPDAPFDKNWHELAMKRMLRYAAENGYDVIAWTKGDQQNQRYGLSKVVDEIYVDEYFASTKREESSFRMILKNGDNNHVGVNKKTGIVTFYNEQPQAIGRPLSELLGKELAEKILAARDYQTFRGVDFELSEGMKGFYDRMLPAFMNKYGKKWGVKVEDIELPGLEESARIMHSVPVTEEMKSSVMEGQVMFRTKYDVNTNPTEAQKKAGNYKMGHLRLDGYNITIENPKGSVRRGTDSKGNAWENTLNNDYGYIRGTEGVDGDHIDVYLSDNPSEGNVFVIDQVNPQTREFDEHKVMYGFNSAEEAREAYLANFSEGWNGLGTITEVSKDEFKKWIESSHRKTKPFSEYKSVKTMGGQSESYNEEVFFYGTGTPTEDVVARGLELSRQDAARLAGDIYSIMPADIRKQVSAEALNNGMDLQKTIFQISASLAEKDSLSDEETAFAKSVADILEQRLLDDGVEMTRPLTTSEALWMLWRNSNPVGEDDVFGAARRAVVADNLGMSTRFRATDKRNDSDNRSKQFREATASAAADAYNRSVSFWKNRLKESYVDNMDSVNILVEAIEKASGKAAQGWEDIRLTMNQLSSKGLSAMEKFIRDYLHPMWDAVESIMKKMDIDKADVERYIMLESGLERNEVFAKRDAKAKHQDEYDKQIRSIEGMEVTDEEKTALKVKAKNTLDRRLAAVDAGTDATYKKMRERDYGAVMAQFAEYAPIKDQSAYGSLEEYNRAKLNSRRLKYSTVEEAESAAWEEINAFRQKAGEELIDNLWKRINAATKATLKQQYEANMLSKAQYDHIRGMFKYYVPMRGFADNTAEDMYSYYANGQNDFAAPVLKAKGRTTMAESPLGHIGAMASSGIAQGLKNEAKLALYYFVLNRPNDLISVDKTWYVDTGRADEEGKAIFEAKYPPMTGALSEEKARADYEKWQNEMKELEKQGKAVRGSRKLDLKNSVIHITPSSAKEHTITVKVGGEEITMFINGNPRAAQAVNGLLNIEASDKFEGMRKYLRFLSSVNTSFNPEFWMTNLQRDMLFTAMAISSKEDAQYNKAFRENYWKAWKAVTMVRKDKNGTLGDSHVEQLFKEFVENGGPTGYTKVIGNEEWEKTMNKYLSRKDRPKVESIRKAFDALQSFSEGIEQVSRFAAYMTSREMGRSVQQSISDAKEVTVNFNRKGSGQEITEEEVDKLTDENGQPLSELSKFCIRMISKISPYGRGFLMFFNASVQGLNSFVRLTKNNPKAMSIWASGYLMLGILNASLHAMLDDDDEYLDIPDYERRTSLLLGGNGAYFKWALPQEARAFYALGDLFVNRTLDRMPHQNVIWEATKILFDVAPLNPTEGIAGVLPPYVATVVELATNKDYKGAKIYKDMAYLSDEAKKGVPEYTKTFSGTSEVAVALSRAINWLSGGDYATSGYLDGFLTNPAVMQHVVESQLGGTLRTINKALDTIWNIGGLAVGAEDAEFTVRNTPFLNRLLTINDERYRNSHTTDLYKHYKGVAANAKRREKEYSAAHDSENLNNLRSSEDYAVFQIYQRHKKVLDMYDKQLKLARNEQERRLIMQRQDAERKRVIEEISRL